MVLESDETLPMTGSLPYQLLADLVLALHFAIALFVVGGLGVIVVGNLCRWSWVNHRWFRFVHLIAIGVIVAQAWLGRICPLTSLEMWLRQQARTATYSGSWVEHWLQRLLYYEAPDWVFMLVYSLFALAVAASWWSFPPSGRR
jgi:hypothetical protein